MRTYLRVWWRGIGVTGVYICLSIGVAAVGLVTEALPDRIKFVVGVPLLIVALPPLLFCIFHWIYPEATAAKSRFSKDRPE